MAGSLTKKEASRIPILEAIQEGKIRGPEGEMGDNMRYPYIVATTGLCTAKLKAKTLRVSQRDLDIKWRYDLVCSLI